ncbi:MAG: KpsF/GutQ family sugar-phosphate isomerase [Geminicoccaceae bacterium]|nr:KpsF/GutQ family sugar-phosphate isomerase [Geminicoccaceae bacterium]
MNATSLQRISSPRSAEGARAAGRRVLAVEADALTTLAQALDDSFERAVERLAGVAGRVVVTGMGKSGHIARKIASSFASTGTPALFVHPAEASHGDLGMITAADLVLALSNSGETPELAHLVDYSRRFEIPLVAMVGRRRSALADAADVALVLPPLEEACPLGLAPTTSTTCMLALGDALAVALLERRGFGANDFGVLHPGGRLGQRLIRVAELMHQGSAVPLVALAAPMSEALLVMTEKRLGCVGVLDGPRLAGIITDGDLRRHMSPDLLDQPAAAVMTPDPRTIRPQALVSEALSLMNRPERPVTVLFAVDQDGAPEGVLHMHDCLRAGVA